MLLLSAIPGGCAHHASADLVLKNGRIYTVESSPAWAEALAATGETILAVGSNEQVEKYVSGSTQVIDLEGRFALPGFIDGHGHFMSLGLAKMRLDLTTCRNFGEMIEKAAGACRVARTGKWVVGRGWHQEKWDRAPEPAVEGLPLHDELSSACPENPVLLVHASGHSGIVNARAMQLAGISSRTPDPAGGHIVRDTAGNPTGVFSETALDLLTDELDASLAKRKPGKIEADRQRAFELATAECLSKGVTSFQDAGSTFEVIDFYSRLAEQNELIVRMWVMILEDNEDLSGKLADYHIIGKGDDHLTVRAVKRIVDGALGSHGAWFLEPYSDRPGNSGLNATPLDEIEVTAQMAIESGFQLCIHAIGDRGNREVLDLYQRTFEAHPDKNDLRWRIEHAQHLHPADIPRFAELDVVASMQGIHCTSDGPWVIERLGEKRAEEGAYAWRSLVESGAVVSNGTDTPVEDVDPIANFHALVTRKMKDGRTFFPDQCLSREQAIDAYTINAAHAAFEEDIKGSLAPGKLADIVVLSKDILSVPEVEIRDTEVVMTIVGGEIVFENGDIKRPVSRPEPVPR